MRCLYALVLASCAISATLAQDYPYRVGVGIADITGPPVEINFMGYAELSQSGTGIHTRQFARAFVFERDGVRVVYVVADVLAVGIAVRREVVSRLQEHFGTTYTLRNVIIAGTHTHAGPGGHLVDFILDLSILGFSQETYEAYVSGITESIVRAHNNMVSARLVYSEEDVEDSGINRSQFSYENNPSEERARYQRSVDTTLSQIRIERQDGNLHGVLNWFPVHTTSMNNSNHLVSSDNLGFAALAMEKELNGALAGEADIITAFAPSNMGDVSPNTEGPRCEISGRICDNQFLLCDLLERCFASGPGDDMFHSTKIIGGFIYQGAMRALNRPGEVLNDGLGVVHQFVSFPDEVVPRYDAVQKRFIASEQVRGCSPALGYSFASGTTDGANVLNITQGTLEGNPLLDLVGNIVAEPTAEDIQCHLPKPIFLATGRATVPFEWHQNIASASLINLGGVIIAGVPGEPTTMSGRRIKDVVGDVMMQNGRTPRVVVSALVNEYIHYVATTEEYQIQRYEAASTIYGPHTLDIFLNKYDEFARVFYGGGQVAAGQEPLDNRDRTISLILPVVMDTSPAGRNFGDVLLQPARTAQRGSVVRANFVSANPRNDLRHGGSYLLVERQAGTQWVVVARDADWSTRFIWDRTFLAMANSRATVEWTVPSDQVTGTYRIRYFGASRSLLGRITQFVGETDTFQVVA